MKTPEKIALVVVAALVIFAIVLTADLFNRANECEASGGFMARGVWGYECTGRQQGKAK